MSRFDADSDGLGARLPQRQPCWIFSLMIFGACLTGWSLIWSMMHPQVSGKVLEVLSPTVVDTDCVVGNCTRTAHPIEIECGKRLSDGTCWESDAGTTLQCSNTCMRTLQGRWRIEDGWIWESLNHRCKEYQVECLRKLRDLVGTHFHGRQVDGNIVDGYSGSGMVLMVGIVGLVIVGVAVCLDPRMHG